MIVVGSCYFLLTLLIPYDPNINFVFPLTVLCENENFIISNLHCFFANVTPCPLVLLSSLTEKQIFLVNMFIPIQYFILNTSIRSPLNLLVSGVFKPHSFRCISQLIFLSFCIILVALFVLSLAYQYPSCDMASSCCIRKRYF